MKPKKKGFWTGTDYSFCNAIDCSFKKTCLRHMDNYTWNENDVYIAILIPPHNKHFCDMYWNYKRT